MIPTHTVVAPASLRRRAWVALVWFMSWLIAVQPILVHAADIAVDTAAADANRPRIDAAANGVTVVDIVAPNGAGLSHNKYLRFGVDAAGAVLNNSTGTVSLSQLGGLLQGNANLADTGAARVILNEVTSANRSQLAGALEVHGTAADVIVANPNGITCDGCRFINTPRATLSTGAPELGADGALEALRVEGGDILVAARGGAMDATEVFDLVARGIAVEGPVNAGGALNLVAGRNLYDYPTGLATPLAPDESAPAIAIDSSLLGGMYAGRIAIVSNDLGAGVRMHGQMAAAAEDLTLRADGLLELRNATAAGAIDARSAAGAIVVVDTLYAGGDVSLAAANGLTNTGSIGSGAALDIDLGGDLTNRGLLYAGTSAHFRLDGDFTNEDADIFAQTDLTVEGLSGERAGDFLNSSGTIEAVAGDLTLKAASVTNKKRAFAVGQTSTSTTTESPGWGQHRQDGTRTTVTVTTLSVDEDSPAAKLLAGDGMTIETGTLANEYSQIAANGAITFTADMATNVGHDLIETTETQTETSSWYKKCKYWGLKCRWRQTIQTSTSTSTSTLSSVYGTIEAGGALTVDVEGYLENDAVRDGQIGLWSGIHPQDKLDSAIAALDATLEALVERTALFDFDPDAPYLLETRPEFIDPGLYLGSDYFFERAGIVEPDVTMKRFGDAHVETRLVQEQVFTLTGARYLAGFSDARAQMRRLYDNANDAQVALDLAIGVALAPDQIAALNDDILWLEYRTVRGQKVLVPRLYLATATVADIDLASARIHGGRTAIAAATLVNSGRIAGVEGLDIKTADTLINRGGALASEGDVDIAAGALFANLSGTVSGSGVRISADDIVHATAVLRDQYDNGFADRAQQRARIASKGDLTLDATHSIAATGAEIDAGGDAVLSAGGDIAIEALPLERRFEDIFSAGYGRSESVAHTLATVRAGGDVTVEAGANLTLRGAELAAGGDAELTAGGDVTVASVQDSYHDDLKIDAKGGLFGSGTKIRRQSAEVQTQRTTISAGGALTVRAGTGDLALDAASLQSEGETVLEAPEGEVALLTETDSSFEQDYERRESLVWFKEKDKGHYKEEIEHVEIEAGGGLKIHAGEGVVVEYRTTGSLEASLDQLAQSPGLAWIEQLRNDPSVDWRAVEAAFEEWDYKTQGLTQAGAALVTLVAVAVTGPALAHLSASIASSLGITNAAMQAALTAGLKTLASQTAVALVNHRGDLGATLRQLGSSASLKSLVTAMVAAGLSVKLTGLAGLDKALPQNAAFADRVVHSLQQNLIRSTVQAGVSTAIQGGKLDDALVAALRQSAAATLGEVVATEIGRAYADAAKDGKNPVEFVVHKVAHAALGCATGAIASGDCGSGAIGGAVGETVSEAYFSAEQQEALAAELAELVESGELKPGELRSRVESWRNRGIDVSRVAAGLSAALAGGDVDVAADTAGTAVRNNICGFGICVAAVLAVIAAVLEVTDKVLIAKDAIDIAVAARSCHNGSQEACGQAKTLAKEAAVEAGIEITIGSLVPGSKAAVDLIQWARKNADGKTVRAIDKATNRPGRTPGAPNNVTSEVNVRNHFTQNRKFWSSDPIQFNGNKVFQRNDLFDPNRVSEWVVKRKTVRGTNLERMASGRAPIGTDGNSINLHHLTQKQDGAIAELTQTFHIKNSGIIHINTGHLPSGINRYQFNTWSKNYWKNRAANWRQ